MSKGKDFSGVISRLRALKEASDVDNQKSGFEAGQKWAENDADLNEFRRLEKASDSESYRSGWSELFEGENSAVALHAVIVGYSSAAEALEFFESYGASQEEMQDGTYIRGFAEGALEIWKAVKDEL